MECGAACATCCACGSGLGTLRIRTVKCSCAGLFVMRGAFESPKINHAHAATCTTMDTAMADDPLRDAGGGEANSVIVREDLMITVGNATQLHDLIPLCGAENAEGGRRDSAASPSLI